MLFDLWGARPLNNLDKSACRPTSDRGDLLTFSVSGKDDQGLNFLFLMQPLPSSLKVGWLAILFPKIRMDSQISLEVSHLFFLIIWIRMTCFWCKIPISRSSYKSRSSSTAMELNRILVRLFSKLVLAVAHIIKEKAKRDNSKFC